MLVLSRQRDETIMIGDDIEITIVDIRGDKVRLGISAPARIAVHRKEVYEAIRVENERASKLDTTDVIGLSADISPGPQRLRRADVRRSRNAPPATTLKRPSANTPTPRRSKT